MATPDVGSGRANERGVETADGGDASDRPLTLADFKTHAADRLGACPKKGKCAVKTGKFKASKAVRVAMRRAGQETKEFRDIHRMRRGIEATNSELNSKCGIKHLRYRGLIKAKAAVLLRALCPNISRVGRYRSRKGMVSW